MSFYNNPGCKNKHFEIYIEYPNRSCFYEADCAKVENTDNWYNKVNCVKTPEAFLDK